jgi:dienelactone hydrolase
MTIVSIDLLTPRRHSHDFVNRWCSLNLLWSIQPQPIPDRFFMIRLFTLIAFFTTPFLGTAFSETVTFKAKDGVLVTADTGGAGTGAVVVLYHMAGASRGEYRDIAPRLHKLGYRTLAVDQRSGSGFNGVRNETAKRVGGNAGYAAALPDVLAASDYARNVMKAKKVGVLGSSYSSSLVLVAAGRDAKFADAVMSFSPGEYFSNRKLVTKSAAQIKVPVFLTAARNEIGQVKPIAKVIPTDAILFKPKGSGKHGATALVSGSGTEYWAALESFLAKKLPVK